VVLLVLLWWWGLLKADNRLRSIPIGLLRLLLLLLLVSSGNPGELRGDGVTSADTHGT
jgi:hypothetical protein